MTCDYLFDIILPEINNPSQKIKTQAIADGYWIILHSLKAGTNKIHFKVDTSVQEIPSEKNTVTAQQNKLVTDVWIHLNIKDV
jgi:hypothetical protein